MNDTDDLKLISSGLKSAGLLVTRVPKSHTMRCDLRAQDEHEHYLIEVKGIHDDEAIAQQLKRSESYRRSRLVNDRDSLWKKIGKAVDQLCETPGEVRDVLRIVALIDHSWLGSKGNKSRIIDHLYGMRTIVDLGMTPPTSYDCLYFSESIFFKHRLNLDAVILIGTEGAGVFVNDHSTRAQRVRDSLIGRLFAESGLLHDAGKIEREAGFLVADCNLDRKHSFGVLKYLAAKYNLKKPINMISSDFRLAFTLPVD